MLKLIQRKRKSNRTMALANELKYMFQLSSQVTKVDLKDWLESTYHVRVRSIRILKPYKKARRSHRYQRIKLAIVALSPIIRDVTDLSVKYRVETTSPNLKMKTLSVVRGQPALKLQASKPVRGIEFIVSRSSWPFLRQEWTRIATKFQDQTSLPSFVQQLSIVDIVTQWFKPGVTQLVYFLQTVGYRLLPAWIPAPSTLTVVSTWREVFDASPSHTWPFPWRWVGNLHLYWLSQWEAQKRAETEAQKKAAAVKAQRKAAEAEAKQQAAEAEAKQQAAEAEEKQKAKALKAQQQVAAGEAKQKQQKKPKTQRGFGSLAMQKADQRVKKRSKSVSKQPVSQPPKWLMKPPQRVPVYVSPFQDSWMHTMWPAWKQGLIWFRGEIRRYKDNIIR